MSDKLIKNYLETIQQLKNQVRDCENRIDIIMTVVFILSINLYMVDTEIQQEIISGMVPKLITNFQNIGIQKEAIDKALKIAKEVVENVSKEMDSA